MPPHQAVDEFESLFPSLISGVPAPDASPLVPVTLLARGGALSDAVEVPASFCALLSVCVGVTEAPQEISRLAASSHLFLYASHRPSRGVWREGLCSRCGFSGRRKLSCSLSFPEGVLRLQLRMPFCHGLITSLPPTSTLAASPTTGGVQREDRVRLRIFEAST